MKVASTNMTVKVEEVLEEKVGKTWGLFRWGFMKRERNLGCFQDFCKEEKEQVSWA